ncbi:hypothetical protein [Pseudomonas alliivorans]|uniref:hypothetical protein n=1 Tax=Pseudomonas alliivorans TaxID=2810613 RepID=UPI002091682A|nr:hypothetical protein [Pseudomonas alliivorans]MCO5364776.1 hypothetical protein [Pseudomonas alliivorans]
MKWGIGVLTDMESDRRDDVGTIALDDARGYFKELAAPSFIEFWSEYQEDIPVDIGRYSFIYRRLITALFFLNHMTDKVATQRGFKKPEDVIAAVKSMDMKAGIALDVCRQLTNDVKHLKNQPQTYGVRERSDTDNVGDNQLPTWIFTDKSGRDYDLCDVAYDVWSYWLDNRHQRKST